MIPGGFGRPMGGDEMDGEQMAALLAQAQAAQGGGANEAELNAMLAMLGGGASGRMDDEDDEDEEEDDDDEDIDETLSERLIGLTEMFPDRLRRLTAALLGGVLGTVIWTWRNGQSLAWAITSTSMVAVMPVVLERERHQFQQEQIAQQRQVLLGPGASPTQAGHSMYGGLVPPGLK